jgi:hypothetical protein
VPDPSYGDEGQLAFKPSTGQWWVKQGGVWVPSAGLTALGYGGTSATSVLIGLSPPPKAFTTQTSLAYNGARVRAASAANLNNFMEGVASYSGSTLTMTADSIGGSGTFADWLFSIAGAKGATGSTGATGPAGPQGIAGPPGASGSGSGNVNGPVSSVNDNIAVFNGTTGTVIKDGGKTIAELGNVLGPASAVNNNFAAFDLTTGKLIKDSGAAAASFATPGSVTTEVTNKAVRYDAAQTLTAAQQSQARANIAVPGANTVINGAFTINQEGYVSGAVLAAGAYAHDQWKAGSSGGDYSFTQLKSSTTITIAVGKSLIQPIEDVRVRGGTYVLSWTGTAQARAGVNSLTPSGAYASSPLIINSQTAGTVMSVEFNAGTLGNVSLAEGTVAPPFVVPDFASELLTCQRYFEKTYPSGDAPGKIYGTYSGGSPVHSTMYTATNFAITPHRFVVRKRTAPTIVIYSPFTGAAGAVYASGASNGDVSAFIDSDHSDSGLSVVINNAPLVAITKLYFHLVAKARL